MNAKIFLRSAAATLVALVSLVATAAESKPLAIPDFTKGDSIPANAKHDWTLGATGARGWIFCDKLVTADARQIAITKVESGSPATGVLVVGDVLLGCGGKVFSHDPRTELGQALTLAETTASGGNLRLTRWLVDAAHSSRWDLAEDRPEGAAQNGLARVEQKPLTLTGGNVVVELDLPANSATFIAIDVTK